MSRADRVAELIKKEVSDIITRKLHDPRIGFTSVTGVDIGPDLMNANIYISVYGTEKEKEDTMTALGRASGYVRGELGHRLQLREVPEVHFKRDDSIERGARFFEVLNKVHEQEMPSKPRKPVKVTRTRTPGRKRSKRK